MSSTFKFTSESVESCSFEEKLTDMSPVTDLALTLKSLKTESTGTPTRRISWSDPYKISRVTSCLDELSPSKDSPMFFGVSKKEPKRLKKTVSRKLLSMNVEDDKENMPPKESNWGELMSTESDDINGSQDSGYCSTSAKKCGSFASGSSTRFRARSSLFTSTPEDIEGTFPLDDDSNMEPEADSSVISLLTKPLCSIDKPDNSANKEKPTRRCLITDIEKSCDSSYMVIDVPQDYIQIVTQESYQITSTNSEPLEKLKLPFKRPDPSTIIALQSKRRKSSPSINLSEMDSDSVDFVKQRSFSETAASIMQAVQKADLQPDLIGDCSRYYALPLVKGRHQDLKCISPETLASVIKGEYREKIDGYTLIDCRYPYEYEGGHIQGAVNIYTKDDIIEAFLKDAPGTLNKNIVIFHCEFSSERAPTLCRFLRNKDREVNECCYPKLHHPEIYLLEGGYKAFFQNFQELCEPQDYKPMNHRDHCSELRLYRSKSKSWSSDSKCRFKMKSTSQDTDV